MVRYTREVKLKSGEIVLIVADGGDVVHPRTLDIESETGEVTLALVIKCKTESDAAYKIRVCAEEFAKQLRGIIINPPQ